MRQVLLGMFVFALTATTVGIAQTPAPPQTPAYDAKFVVGTDGTVYAGSTTFQVDSKGAASGVMSLSVPTVVNGKLSGPVKDGTWTVQIDFAIPDQNCQGTLTGTAKVPADQKVIAGTVRVAGGCTQDPVDASFTFTRR